MFPAPHASRPLVKICGLTRLGDVAACADAGADALGFNFYPPSKRFLTWEQAVPLLRAVPAGISRVAVLVNNPADEVRRIAESGLIDCLQFHGDESPETVAEWQRTGLPVIRATALRNSSEIPALAVWPTDYLLLDAYAPGAYGGTGAAADWALAAAAVHEFPGKPVLIAGGLVPGNVAAALQTTSAAGADVAGGVESAPGIKDAALVHAFIQAVQATPSGSRA